EMMGPEKMGMADLPDDAGDTGEASVIEEEDAMPVAVGAAAGSHGADVREAAEPAPRAQTPQLSAQLSGQPVGQPSAPADFPDAPVQRATGPVRFAWRTDADGRFSQISPEFALAVGAE